MTVSYFAPLPPARTGVADYAAALLGALRKLGDVRRNFPSADVCLYHLGNNQLHKPMYRMALEYPGVVVLHDAVLNHFFLGWLPRERYIEEFVYNYGEWSRGLAAELWDQRSRSAQDPRYFSHPMLKRIAEVSRAVVVHNPAAARIVREHSSGATVYEIPHLFAPPRPVPLAESLRWRDRNGIPQAAFLFGVFGHLRESKRLPAVLAAFDDLRREDLKVALLVAGDFASPDLERALAPCLKAPGIVRCGFAPPDLFWTLAAAVDGCINLRYPSAGETSGIAIRLMGIGKPVIVTASEENSRFPEPSCLRVETAAERPMLAAHMRLLAASPVAAREIGRHAAEHIAAGHDPDAVARRYWEVLCSHSS